MKHMLTSSVAVSALVLATSSAFAGGQSGTIGVGVERQINNEAGGASVNYDAGKFHVGGFFSFHDEGDGPDADNNHFLSLGARFFYHLHQTAMSDFGVGMGVGLANVPAPMMMDPDNRETHLYLEPSVQIRLFLASNVALSFTAGLVIGTLDADGVDFDGQGLGVAGANAGGALPTALAGVHYYFF